MSEWLGEDVRELPTSFDELDDVREFAPVVQNRILREGDGKLVVHHQCWWVSFHAGQLAQQLA